MHNESFLIPIHCAGFIYSGFWRLTAWGFHLICAKLTAGLKADQPSPVRGTAALERFEARKLRGLALARRAPSSLHSVARRFSPFRSFPCSFSRAGHLQGIHGDEPLSVRVHGQEGVFQGHGAEQSWLPLLRRRRPAWETVALPAG